MKILPISQLLVIVAAMLPGYLAAAESNDIHCSYTYNGQAMTPENILELAPKVPQDIEQKVQNFFAQKPDFAYIFSGESYYTKIPFSNHAPYAINFNQIMPQDLLFFEAMRQALARAGIQVAAVPQGINPMIQNFTIRLGDDLLIKSAGYWNRRGNILHEMGADNQDRYFPQAKLDAFIKDYGPKTYQTISRMPYWLMVKEAIEKYNLDRIRLPKMYVVHIPGRPTEVSDGNYVIVEENIGGAIAGAVGSIYDTEIMKDPEMKRQFEIVKNYANLWDNSAPNYHVNKGILYPVDFEGPNNQKPSNFFWKNSVKK